MSSIEELVYSAYQQGKRDKLYKEVKNIRNNNPNMPLDEVYDKAYEIVLKT